MSELFFALVGVAIILLMLISLRDGDDGRW